LTKTALIEVPRANLILNGVLGEDHFVVVNLDAYGLGLQRAICDMQSSHAQFDSAAFAAV
jgi:hypothetical protein